MMNYDVLRSQLENLSPDKEMLLRAYCSATERYEEAERRIKSMGSLLRDKNTNKPIPNPYITILKESLQQLTTLAKQLGIDKIATETNPLVHKYEYTSQQRKFCRYYAESGKVGESAIKAGYAPRSASVTGSNLLKEQKILSLITSEKKRLRALEERSPEDVLVDVRALTKKALAAGDIKTALSCYQMEARYLGMFSENTTDTPATQPLPLYAESPYTYDETTKPKRIKVEEID